MGLLGVFDTSETIALTLDYQLSLVDAVEIISKPIDEPAIPPIIIFVIIICSAFLLLLISIGVFYCYRIISSRKRTLIKMNNEIQFKRGDTFQKHPLNNENGAKVSSDEEKYEKDVSTINGPAKLSNFLVS